LLALKIYDASKKRLVEIDRRFSRFSVRHWNLKLKPAPCVGPVQSQHDSDAAAFYFAACRIARYDMVIRLIVCKPQ
jgi:hypothetical protein